MNAELLPRRGELPLQTDLVVPQRYDRLHANGGNKRWARETTRTPPETAQIGLYFTSN